MKFLLPLALTLASLVAADVSHLHIGGSGSSGQHAHLHSYAEAAGQQSVQAVLGADANSYAHEQVEDQSADDALSYQSAPSIPFHLGQTEAVAEPAAAVPGDDASSYQPEHLIPSYVLHGAVHAAAVAAPAEDASSYQPADLIQAQLGQAEAAAVPGDDDSSYQSAHLQAVHVEAVPAAIGADSYTPEQFIPAAEQNAQQEYIEAQAYLEPQSNGIEAFNAEAHQSVVIGHDTLTQTHLLGAKYTNQQDTQYGSNGGYVY